MRINYYYFNTFQGASLAVLLANFLLTQFVSNRELNMKFNKYYSDGTNT